VARKFTLYWSSFENYEKCPQLFLWGKGWGALDVGGGPGKPKPKPLKDSRHHAVLGIVIQKVIERLYNEELWRTPAGLPERLEALVEKEFAYEIQRNFIDWRIAPSKFEMLRTCREGVSGFLRTLKAQKLLGPYARAEVELLGWVNPSTPIGGRADLVLRREDTGTTILDGKNSKDKGRYTDPDQLRWYALCYYLGYGKIPDRLGFLYYRYPAGLENPDGTVESGVDWVTATKADIEGLAKRVVDARKAMEEEKFEANPSPKTCKYCDYQTVCDARQAQKAANARTRKKKDSDELDLGDGFSELEL